MFWLNHFFHKLYSRLKFKSLLAFRFFMGLCFSKIFLLHYQSFKTLKPHSNSHFKRFYQKLTLEINLFTNVWKVKNYFVKFVWVIIILINYWYIFLKLFAFSIESRRKAFSSWCFRIIFLILVNCLCKFRMILNELP